MEGKVLESLAQSVNHCVCFFASCLALPSNTGRGARPLKTTIKYNIMPFKKGKSGNPKGRPKGKPNKSTGAIREFVASLIDENRELIRQDIAGLSSKDRLQFIERLLQYIIPKMESRKDDIRFEQLSESDISSIADNILRSIDDEDTIEER